MKKLILILMAMALVFAVGVVYANESMPIAKDMRSVVQDDGITYAALDNGVTFVGVVDAGIQCASEGGMAAGGVSKELRKIVQDDRFTYTALDNGISFSAEIPNPACSWARGLGRDLELHNGITAVGK